MALQHELEVYDAAVEREKALAKEEKALANKRSPRSKRTFSLCCVA